jgi:hypothetical protein
VPQQGLETSAVDIARAAAALFREDRMPVSLGVWYSDGSCWQSDIGCDPLRRAEWDALLAETLRSGLEPTSHTRYRPVCVGIWFSDHSCVHHTLPPGEPPVAGGAESLSQCKRDITRILYETGHRLTTGPILRGLQDRNLIWGESTVKRALAEMVRDGELTNCSDARPRGYGLPSWV